jgi:VWFA-related protein
MTQTQRAVLACIGIPLLSSALFLAQDTLRTTVNEVRVPVTVRDENGALVGGLRKEDFIVLESGRPQMIASFSTESQPISAVIIVDTDITPDQLRRFGLVSGTMMKSFKATDEFAVYRYDHVVTKLSDFTSNPQNLEKSFDAIKDMADARPQDSAPGVAVGPSPLRWLLDRTQVGTAGAPAQPDHPAGPIGPAQSTGTTSNKAPTPSRVLHDAVFTAAAELEKRPSDRRRIILLVSNGQVEGDNEHSQRETVSRLDRDSVQVYAVDPEHKIFNHMTLLNNYTHETGGAVFDGSIVEGMARGFAQVVEQARDQYMLGYYSNNEIADNKPVLRSINVKIKDNKKYKVVHRQNYMQYPQ